MSSTLPPKGMRDFLPSVKESREYVKNIIRDEYRRNGFIEIETSQIENLENLVKSDGGENTKLIFKILKRGEKLELDRAASEDDIADLGLRFDLTLPLSRFYANNTNELPQVFKALQMGYVFRAERPQKGRYRSFMQCDVDMIGEASNLAEIEILSTVYKTLKRIGLKGIKFKINDRRILKALVEGAGFKAEDFGDVAISLDKIDKVGEEGVIEELRVKNYAPDNIDRLIAINKRFKEDGLTYAKQLSPEGYQNIKEIISTLNALYDDMSLDFDFSLVRGMGYYTGTIFEVFYEGAKSALGGGGRYDEMVGRLCGIDRPACGFSIGYERLVDIIQNEDIELPELKKLALFYGEEDDLVEVLKQADSLRETYDMVSVFKKKKKFFKQVERVREEGYTDYKEYGGEF